MNALKASTGGQTIRISEPVIGDEERQAVLAVLDSGMLAQGDRVRQFEQEFAALCGVRFGIAASNGTTALQAALLALGIGPGDEVITSSFSFIASANAILFTGARPVFADILEDTYDLDPDSIEASITSRTKAIMPVHLFGNPCNMSRIMTIAQGHGLRVLEDACQAHGASIDGRRVGSFDVAAFSFYGTKNMTTGEGGMITTNDEALAQACRLVRNHGQLEQYRHATVGYNFRLTDIQAALGICQLNRLQSANERRSANAAYYDRLLPAWAVRPARTAGAQHVYHQYTIRVPSSQPESRRRDALVRHLAEHNVQAGVYYPVPIHQQQAYLRLNVRQSLPRAEAASAAVLSLPIHPRLTSEDLARVVEAVSAFTC